jgi:hypothetical protein
MKRTHEVCFEGKDVTTINGGKDLYIDIEKMYEYFKDTGDLTLYYYFESMCKLVSLMCLDRNSNGINILENIYTVDFVIDCFLSPNIPDMLRANLAKILITLHIDKDPLEPIQIPILARVW